MEECILRAPTLSQAMRLKANELQKRFEEHTVSDVCNLSDDKDRHSFCTIPHRAT